MTRRISRQPAARSVTRKDFTDRLGLPEDASNARVFAALDEILSTNRAAEQAEEIYAVAYGRR